MLLLLLAWYCYSTSEDWRIEGGDLVAVCSHEWTVTQSISLLLGAGSHSVDYFTDQANIVASKGGIVARCPVQLC